MFLDQVDVSKDLHLVVAIGLLVPDVAHDRCSVVPLVDLLVVALVVVDLEQHLDVVLVVVAQGCLMRYFILLIRRTRLITRPRSSS